LSETAPTAEGIEKILSSVGVDADSERISQLFAALEGKDINELIAEGQSKLASVPSGGAAVAGGAAGAAAGGAEAAAEEKPAEEEEESDDDMGFGLFD
ncbi:60S acidic ribosomal protein P2, partial [Dipsacomyces acuminosporus]